MIKAILIPTNESFIYKILSEYRLYRTTPNTNVCVRTNADLQCYDIILVDTEAEINEGDLLYSIVNSNNKRCYTCKNIAFNNSEWNNSKENKNKLFKVISSTNKSHTVDLGHLCLDVLPQLSPQSIQLLFNHYNEHKVLPESVEIKLNEIDSQDYYAELNYYGRTDLELEYEIKLNQQGKVDITIPEINKTIDENLLYTFLHYLHHGTETRFYDSFESIVESFKKCKSNYTKEKIYTEEEIFILGDDYEEYCINCFGNLPMSFTEWVNSKKK